MELRSGEIRNVGVLFRGLARVLLVFRKLKATVLKLTWEALEAVENAVLDPILFNFEKVGEKSEQRFVIEWKVWERV